MHILCILWEPPVSIKSRCVYILSMQGGSLPKIQCTHLWAFMQKIPKQDHLQIAVDPDEMPQKLLQAVNSDEIRVSTVFYDKTIFMDRNTLLFRNFSLNQCPPSIKYNESLQVIVSNQKEKWVESDIV